MASIFCKDACLWVNDVGDRQMRVALLSLEPGSRVWLEVEGASILFERMQDGSDGSSTRGFMPVGETAALWLRKYRAGTVEMLEFEFVERPEDARASGIGFFQLEDGMLPVS